MGALIAVLDFWWRLLLERGKLRSTIFLFLSLSILEESKNHDSISFHQSSTFSQWVMVCRIAGVIFYRILKVIWDENTQGNLFRNHSFKFVYLSDATFEWKRIERMTIQAMFKSRVLPTRCFLFQMYSTWNTPRLSLLCCSQTVYITSVAK